VIPSEWCLYNGGGACITAYYDCDMEGIAETLVAEITTTTSTSTSTSTSTTTTTTTTSPLSYHMEMCVNSTTYDEINEVNIPYVPVNLITTPTKAGYNYLFFSIPSGMSFIIHDSLGTEVTSEFAIDVASGVGGVDSRIGYYDNTIYKGTDMFATSFSVEYTLTLT